MLFSKLFGTKSEREMKKLAPVISQINQKYESLSTKSQNDLLNKTVELKEFVIKTRLDKEKSLSRLEKHKYISYYNSDYKLTDKQKNMMMRADLADEHKQIGLLKSQLSFYQEGIQTLDKMGWAAKIRVDIDR